MSGRVRIIGGKWRSRLLSFPSVDALRPTPDAVRETAFNWLSQSIEGMACLDLYAGSGALGFEAVSRGAQSAVLVEKNTKVVKALRASKELVDSADQIEITACAGLEYIATTVRKFDLIFLDPPFASDELAKACYHIDKMNLLNLDGLVYLESPSDLKKLPIPDTWVVLKQAHKGAVSYTLAQFKTTKEISPIDV
ncbi:MAG: 16S rRNA (guanine966-N2)-methyltransferase [Saprospiraceae bacterium]|jgi:16S rRNA (guanine966-N2)-methyltransferase